MSVRIKTKPGWFGSHTVRVETSDVAPNIVSHYLILLSGYQPFIGRESCPAVLLRPRLSWGKGEKDGKGKDGKDGKGKGKDWKDGKEGRDPKGLAKGKGEGKGKAEKGKGKDEGKGREKGGKGKDGKGKKGEKGKGRRRGGGWVGSCQLMQLGAMFCFSRQGLRFPSRGDPHGSIYMDLLCWTCIFRASRDVGQMIDSSINTGSSLAISSGLDLPLVVPLVMVLSNQDLNPQSAINL